MRIEEYEIAIGKLVILRQFLTHNHHDNVDGLIEDLVGEFLEKRISGELNNNEGVCADCGEHCEMEQV